MNLSYDMVRRILDRTLGDDYQYCHEYGEPGYSHPYGATTPIIVFGDYWCRCDKALRGIDDYNGRVGLHTYEDHYPRLWARMEDQGVSFEWYDEWYIDYDNDKCYRTTGDSYSWQSLIQWTEDGEVLTPDDGIDEWLEWAINDPNRCLPSRVWSSGDLIMAGFTSYNGTYNNGWHEGMDDDPKKITDKIRHYEGDEDECEIVFLLDEASQFYIGFSAWTRKVTTKDDTDD